MLPYYSPLFTQAQAAARKLFASTLPLMKFPPVNLGIICDWLGVDVYLKPAYKLGAVSSRTADGKVFLTVNDKLPQGRLRFSIAHELGHLILNHPPLKRIFERNDEEERQADVFAAELLLPEDKLRQDCLRYTAQELTVRYKVSRQPLDIRLSGLSLTPLVELDI